MLSSLKISLEEDGSSSRYGEFSATSKSSVSPPPFLKTLNRSDSFAREMLMLSTDSEQVHSLEHATLALNLHP